MFWRNQAEIKKKKNIQKMLKNMIKNEKIEQINKTNKKLPKIT